MTNAEKLEAITAKLHELAALCEHFRSTDRFQDIQQAKAFTLDKIAEIVGIAI